MLRMKDIHAYLESGLLKNRPVGCLTVKTIPLQFLLLREKVCQIFSDGNVRQARALRVLKNVKQPLSAQFS